MADHSRLEDLRRRVEKDPASIAFAQLAEEYRRAGDDEQAIEVCRAGLKIHPGYLSARVTLGRALLEINQLDEAQRELEVVLRSAPENLAAIRGLADIHHRRGELPEALAQYRAALAIARNDPDLERTVEELTRQVAPQPRPEPANGLSFAQMHEELLAHAPAEDAPKREVAASNEAPDTAASGATGDPVASIAPVAPVTPAAPDVALAAPIEPIAPAVAFVAPVEPVAPDVALAAPIEPIAPAAAFVAPVEPVAPDVAFAAPIEPIAPDVAFVAPIEPVAPDVALVARVAPVAPEVASRYNAAPDATTERAHRTIAALELWLDALNVPRTDRHPRAAS